MASVTYDHSVVASSHLPLYSLTVFIVIRWVTNPVPFKSEFIFNLSIILLTGRIILKE